MKKFLFFSLCSFLISQLMAQPFQKKQITNFNYDSRGAAFPTYPTFGFFMGDFPCVFYEAHENNSANIIMLSYNPDSDSFFCPVAITSNIFKNINLIADASSLYPLKINLVWQTNEHGNWDIALRTLTDSIWGVKKFIIYTPGDETNPKFVPKNYWFSTNNEIEILYEKESSIYLYEQGDSVVKNELIFSGDSTTTYSQPTGVHFIASPWTPPAGLYVAATCKLNDSTSRIVYRYKVFNDSIWSPIYNAYDSGYCGNPIFYHGYFGDPFLSVERNLNGNKQVIIIPEISYLGQNQHAVSLIDNPNISTSDLTAFQYSLITRNKQFDIYGPHSYKYISQDSNYIYCPTQQSWWSQLIYSKVNNTRIGLGNLGISPLGNAISFSIWEDSSNGRINLFGIKRLDNLGDVNDQLMVTDFTLSQNYPNPFNPKTIIKYNMLSRDFVTIKVFDVLGKEVSTLVNEEKSAGEYSVVFDGSNLASGMYVYRLSVGNNHLNRKMILLK